MFILLRGGSDKGQQATQYERQPHQPKPSFAIQKSSFKTTYTSKHQLSTMNGSINPAMAVPKKHKALVYDQPGDISIGIVEVDTPEPGTGEVLIKMYDLLHDGSTLAVQHANTDGYRSHSGVCHSDLSLMLNSVSLLIKSAPSL